MAATWPVTLPTGFMEGTDRETYENNLLRTEMEVGPAKTRRRTTAGAGMLEGTLFLTPTQITTFDSFWRQTLRSGSLPFTFIGLLLMFRDPPSRRFVRTSLGLCAEVSIRLEVLPAV